MKITNDDQEFAVPMIIKLLTGTDETNQVTSNIIIRIMNESNGTKFKMNPSRLRRCINYIRRYEIAVVMSSNKGYYITDDEELVIRTILNIDSRMASMLQARNGIQHMLNTIRNNKTKTKKK